MIRFEDSCYLNDWISSNFVGKTSVFQIFQSHPSRFDKSNSISLFIYYFLLQGMDFNYLNTQTKRHSREIYKREKRRKKSMHTELL